MSEPFVAGRRGPKSELLATAGLVALVLLLAWIYLGWMDWGMRHMEAGAEMWIMPRMTDWDTVDLALVFLMWAVMMVAMMLPSALPAAMLVATVCAGRRRSVGMTGAFVSGYLVAWCSFSLLATLLQWGLLEVALITPMMESASPALSATILIAAGIYQFTPLKNACLRQCQSPLGVAMQAIAGSRPALVAGFRHGVYCVGCCWALMAILFVTGVMSIVWAVLLAIYVVIEKAMLAQRWTARVAGVTLIAWGLGLLTVV